MAIRSMMPWSRGESRPDVANHEDPFDALHRKMDRLFDAFRRDLDFPPIAGWDATTVPSVEVSETADAVKVEIEIPGMNAKDVDLTFEAEYEKGVLHVTLPKGREEKERRRKIEITAR